MLAMVLAADPGSLSVMRERLRRWLAAMGWPPIELAEIVLAVNEAASNTVQHAYPAGDPGEVRVAARAFTDTDRARRVIIGISDDGRWRPARPGGPGGHGLPIMHVCTDTVETHRDPGGTTVLLTSIQLPPPQPGPRAGPVLARGPA